MKRGRVKLLTVFFVAMQYKSRTVVGKFLATLDCCWALTRAGPNRLSSTAPSPSATQSVWELFDGKRRLNPRHTNCLGFFCAAAIAGRLPVINVTVEVAPRLLRLGTPIRGYL